MDLKKEAARAAYALIQTGTSIGLGDGSTMIGLAGLINDGIKNGLQVKLCTSSDKTRAFLNEAGTPVNSISDTDSLDLYFDGCDQVDHELNALKSGAGIHTNEKLVASMAKKFIILADDSKFVSKLDIQFPLVLEVLPQAEHYIYKELKRIFGEVTLATRSLPNSGEPVLTINGNHLIDCRFAEWPALHFIQSHCKMMTGVIDISLFFQIATDAIIAGNDSIRHFQKKNGLVHVVN
jgi:ribose 5-phosphate isomerase A